MTRTNEQGEHHDRQSRRGSAPARTMPRLRLGALAVTAGVAALGLLTPVADAADLEDGDFLVGVSVPHPIEDRGGKIVRIRAGVSTDFCSSSPTPYTNGFFETPREVVLDNHGRVVFIGQLGVSTVGTGDGWGLWRCDVLGATPTMLGAFGGGSALGYPQPVGSVNVCHAQGLHMKRTAGIDLNAGTAASSNLYVFAINKACGSGPFDTIGYDPDSGQWLENLTGPVPTVAPGPNSGGPMDMINAGGYTFSASSSGGLRGVKEPISLRFDVGGILSGGLTLQKITDLGTGSGLTTFFDDLTVPNIVECGPHPDNIPVGTPYNELGSLNGLGGSALIAWRDGGLMLDGGGAHAQAPNITNFALFNFDPADDISSMAHWGLANCAHVNTIQFTPWRGMNDWFDPDGDARGVRQWDPGGRFGTQYGRVIGIGPGVDVIVYAAGLLNAQGIDVYPPFVPTTDGVAVFFKIQSPVNVLITAPDGRRIGADLDTGAPINEFGDGGYDSQTAEPHVYGIGEPLAGNFTVETNGTSAGAYTITVYGANLGTKVVAQAGFSGNTAPGIRSTHGFALDATGGVVAGIGEARDLLVTSYDPLSGNLALSYTAACASSSHDIQYGPLSQVSTYGWSGSVCDIGGSGQFVGFNPGPGSYFFVLVGSAGSAEGPYGTDDQGAERPPSTASTCGRAQVLAVACP